MINARTLGRLNMTVVFLIFIAILIKSIPVFSQEITQETPTQTSSESVIVTETLFAAFTETPTTLAFTPLETLTPSELPPTSAVPAETATASVPATADTITSPAAPSITVDIALSPSPSSVQLPPEPPLGLLFNDTFDIANQAPWAFGAGWGYAAQNAGGMVLQVYNSSAPVSLTEHSSLVNAAVQLRMLVENGSGLLNLRQSTAGSYSASITKDGFVTLYRSGIVVQTAITSPSAVGQWRTLRLSAIDNIIRASVDGIEVMTWVDSVPLPLGGVSFNGLFTPLPDNTTPIPPQNTVQFDDFLLWVPTAELSLTSNAAALPPTLTPSITASATAAAPGIRSAAQMNMSAASLESSASVFVDVSSVAGLIQAMNGANAAPSTPYVIRLAPGTYNLTQITEGYSGLPPVSGIVTVVGTGTSRENTIIRRSPPSVNDPANYFDLFYVHTEGDLTLQNLTLENGGGTEVTTIGRLNGGAIMNFGQLSLIDTLLRNNTVLAQGGALLNIGNANIYLAEFNTNGIASTGGGAIKNEGNLAIDCTRFLNNLGSVGGAIYNVGDATALIQHSRFYDNRATVWSGGAIYNQLTSRPINATRNLWRFLGTSPITHLSFDTNSPNELDSVYSYGGSNPYGNGLNYGQVWTAEPLYMDWTTDQSPAFCPRPTLPAPVLPTPTGTVIPSSTPVPTLTPAPTLTPTWTPVPTNTPTQTVSTLTYTPTPTATQPPACLIGGSEGTVLSRLAYSNIGDIFVIQYVRLPNGTVTFNWFQVTNAANSDFAPAWSPDGSQMAFISQRDMDNNTITNELFVMELNNNCLQRQLIDNMGNQFDPDWSPVDNIIVFSANGSIYTIQSDGTNLQQLAAGFNPTWSADGQEIAYVDMDGFIRVINRSGSLQRILTGTGGDTRDPAWSPDGNWVAFAADRNGAMEIYLMDAQLGEQILPAHKLTSFGLDSFSGPRNTAWSPDGAQVVFSSNPQSSSSGRDLWGVTIDGNDTVTQLQNLTGNEYDPDWVGLVNDPPPPTPSPTAGFCVPSGTPPFGLNSVSALSEGDNCLTPFATNTPLATSEPTIKCLAVVISGPANLRAGPGTDTAVVGSVEVGTIVTAVGRTTTTGWFLIEGTEDYPMGWIKAITDPADLLGFPDPNCVTQPEFRIYPDGTLPFPPTPTLTPLPTYTFTPTLDPNITPSPTATLIPGYCTVSFIKYVGGAFFRSSVTGDQYQTRVFLIYNAIDRSDIPNPYGRDLVGEVFRNGYGTKEYFSVFRLEAVAFAEYDGIEQWMEMQIMSDSPSSMLVTGYMAFSQIDLSGCDTTRLPGYIPPPTPTVPAPAFKFLSCWNFGIEGQSGGGNVNFRPVTLPTAPQGIGVSGMQVQFLGQQNESQIQELLKHTLYGNPITLPPDDVLSGVPPEAAQYGWSMIRFDHDNDPLTVNEWWVLTNLLKDTWDCGTTPTPTPFATMLPTSTPTSVFAGVYSNLGPLYPTVDPSVITGGQNPPAVMGDFGLHIPDGGRLTTLDTMPVSLEACVDSVCVPNSSLYNATYGPDQFIPVYAPVNGCLLTNAKYPSFIPPTVAQLKVNCGDTYPILSLHFTHLARIYMGERVQRGDIIGYICPIKNLVECQTTDTRVTPLTASHLAFSIGWDVGPGEVTGTDAELLGMFSMLHDCFPKNGYSIPPGAISSTLCQMIRTLTTGG